MAAAARLLAGDPNPLGPARVAAALLDMLQCQGEAAGEEEEEEEVAEEGAGPEPAPTPGEEGAQGQGQSQSRHPRTPAWATLLALAHSAAGRVGEPAAQQALLALALLSPHFAPLRAAALEDRGLQADTARLLVAASNRLAATGDQGSSRGGGGGGDDGGGGGAPEAAAATPVPAQQQPPVRVFGEEAVARQRRVAVAVRELLPHALLCPALTLERLVKDAALHPGQVGVGL